VLTLAKLQLPRKARENPLLEAARVPEVRLSGSAEGQKAFLDSMLRLWMYDLYISARPCELGNALRERAIA
jgi:hypothetical protein